MTFTKQIFCFIFLLGLKNYCVCQTKRGCAIEAPEDICISFTTNGDMILNWSPIIDPTNVFLRYEINSTMDGILETISNKNITQYIIDKSKLSHTFFISTISKCVPEESKNSDTIEALKLKLTNPLNGTALLEWSPVTKEIKIEYKNSSVDWTTLNTATNTTQFIDTITVCSDKQYYRISEKKNNCSSNSMELNDLFKDIIVPFTPKISTVSFDTTSHGILLKWDQNKSKDIKGYVIYVSYDGKNLMTLDTLLSPSKSEYQYANASIDATTTFSIAAFDYCLSSSPPSNQTSAKAEKHTTSLLNYDYNLCGKQIELKWIKYVGWEEIKEYHIYQKKGNQPWKKIITTPKQFYNLPTENNVTYSYIIETINGYNEHAFSNPITFIAKAPKQPLFNKIGSVSIENKNIEITPIIDLGSGIKEINIERKDNRNNTFQSIEKITTITNKTSIDKDVQTSLYPYTYRIELIDSCGFGGSYSNEATSMLLKVKTDSSSTDSYLNTLNWTSYKGFTSNVLNYSIYRKLDYELEPTFLCDIPAYQLYYDDYLALNELSIGKIEYYIIANESHSIFNKQMFSKSNSVITHLNPLVFIPNTFVPNGKNIQFKPITSLIQLNNYKMSILDRWGQLLYQTTDINEGWDGKIGSIESPLGSYRYIIEYEDSSNKEYIKRGVVTLLR